jgi:hypothetical protein
VRKPEGYQLLVNNASAGLLGVEGRYSLSTKVRYESCAALYEYPAAVHDAGAVHEIVDKLFTAGPGVGSAVQALPSHASTKVWMLAAKEPAPTAVHAFADAHETS